MPDCYTLGNDFLWLEHALVPVVEDGPSSSRMFVDIFRSPEGYRVATSFTSVRTAGTTKGEPIGPLLVGRWSRGQSLICWPSAFCFLCRSDLEFDLVEIESEIRHVDLNPSHDYLGASAH